MTLEELIDHEEKESKATWNGKPTLCAEEHRQLAEWLKDYKRLKEQEPCIQEKQANAGNIDAVYIDGFKAGYSQARFDLEQEPYEDAISRQAVIEVLNKMDRYVADELTLCDTERKFPKNEVFIVDDVYEEIVERLFQKGYRK